MANEKNVTTVRDEDKTYSQNNQLPSAADVGNKQSQFNSEERK